MDCRLLRGDVLSFARHYNGPKFHALLCDPPYHLTSIVTRFGANDSKSARGGVYARSSKGFMGKQWDGGDLAFRPETWEALSELLFPGAFLMIFSGSRGWHRVACAVEDAGLVIHPSIFGWAYGSGFPKATRIKEQEDTWMGHRYGGQALKPALEPIIVAQKPYEGRPVDNIMESGAGALNIDGGRIETSDLVNIPQSNPDLRQGVVGNDLGISKVGAEKFQAAQRESIERLNSLGRWPANFILMDSEAGDRLDMQSGLLTSGKPVGNKKASNMIYGQYGTGLPITGLGDSGGASRFFFNADWSLDVAERLALADPVKYCAKASRSERDAGLDNHCNHPTVKPLTLTKYLATLLLPPARYAPRRLLVPFGGVASEMIGGLLAGWDCVIGVERESEYVDIGRKRLRYWASTMQPNLF